MKIVIEGDILDYIDEDELKDNIKYQIKSEISNILKDDKNIKEIIIKEVVNEVKDIQFSESIKQALKDKFEQIVIEDYLNEEEMSYLERIVSLYLDYAELQAERHIPMSMEDWANRLDSFLEFNGTEILTGPGKISAEQAKLYAESEYEKYRIIQDRLFMSDFDKYMLEFEETAK